LALAVLLWAATGSAAQAAPDGVPGAPRVTREQRFGNWGYLCAVARDARNRDVERCMISQLVSVNPRARQVVLGLTVDFADSPEVPTLRARFSSNAVRKAGIGIKVDAQPDMRLPIGDCDALRCEAVGRMAQPVLKVWLSGKQARFAYLMDGGRQIVLPVSLNGFGQALDALRQHPGGRPGAVKA
ncbi:invasion associated locus B family protein, partial [Massilia horti]